MTSMFLVFHRLVPHVAKLEKAPRDFFIYQKMNIYANKTNSTAQMKSETRHVIGQIDPMISTFLKV